MLAVQGWIGSAFLIFILLTSNPFARLDPAPLEGQDLNPILQDIGLAIHPPLLYLGYVGFSIAFSFAVAALIEGRTDAAWARWVRPWTLAAWMFLTAGIAMGSYWAYYELGWGGWWFWDPVENASFMPWLAGTALLHSAVVMEKRGALKVWTVLLAILTFSLSLLGTFLVRSGVLTSVHSFAVDPTRGVFILAILTLFIGGALALFALRAPDDEAGRAVRADQPRGRARLQQPLPRRGGLHRVRRHALSARARGVDRREDLRRRAVLQPDLRAADDPALPGAARSGRCLPGSAAIFYGAAQRLGVAMAAALVAALVTAIATGMKGVLAPFGLALGVWLLVGGLVDLAERVMLFRAPLSVSLRRFFGLPRSSLGTVVAHCGMGLCVIGIVAASAFSTEKIVAMKPGDTIDVGGYTLLFKGNAPASGPNYQRRARALRRFPRRQRRLPARAGEALLPDARDDDDRGGDQDDRLLAALPLASATGWTAARPPCAPLISRS